MMLKKQEQPGNAQTDKSMGHTTAEAVRWWNVPSQARVLS